MPPNAIADTINAFRQSPPQPKRPFARSTAPAPAPVRELPIRPRALLGPARHGSHQRRDRGRIAVQEVGHLRGWETKVPLLVSGTGGGAVHRHLLLRRDYKSGALIDRKAAISALTEPGIAPCEVCAPETGLRQE
ncbi:DUF6233 domain-containing protein [Streptomyces microflavus]